MALWLSVLERIACRPMVGEATGERWMGGTSCSIAARKMVSLHYALACFEESEAEVVVGKTKPREIDALIYF